LRRTPNYACGRLHRRRQHRLHPRRGAGEPAGPLPRCARDRLRHRATRRPALSARCRHPRNARCRHSRHAHAPLRRFRIPASLVRQARATAGPVRGIVEPAPHLHVHRRAGVPRPSAARHRLVPAAAAARVRPLPAGREAAVQRPADAVLPVVRQAPHPAADLRPGAGGTRPRRLGGLPRPARGRRARRRPSRTRLAARCGLVRVDPRRDRGRGAVRRDAAHSRVLARDRLGARTRPRPRLGAMRIVHAIARLNVGGAALSVLELAAGQQRRGHDVLVVAGRIPAGEASMEHLAGELGVPHLHLDSLRRDPSPRADLAAVRDLRSFLRAGETDVLHTHTSKAGTTGRVAARIAGRGRPEALVHTFHGHVLSGYFGPARERVYRGIERTLAHVTDRIVAVSDEVRDDLVRLRVAPMEKIAVVPYGFDLDARVRTDDETRRTKRNDLGATDDTLVIGWAGRLTEIKQPLALVRVCAAVDGSALVLAGDGELRPEVEALARQLGVADRVHLLGYVDDIGAWYAAFDV